MTNIKAWGVGRGPEPQVCAATDTVAEGDEYCNRTATVLKINICRLQRQVGNGSPIPGVSPELNPRLYYQSPLALDFLLRVILRDS